MTQETSHTPAMLFDLDGTLIDSVYQHVLAWHEALEELGLTLGVWRIHRRIGMSGGLLVQALSREIGQPLNPEQTQKLQERHAVAYERYRGAIRALPGARELLQQLSRANGRPLERPWNAWVLDQRSPSSHDGKCNAQSRIRICFSLRQNDSVSPSQERWLSATVCGTCWQPGEPVVWGLACFREATEKKNWNS